MRRFLILAIVGALLVPLMPATTTEASPNATIIPLTWHAEYFDNQYLIGPPEVEREEVTLDYDWGTSSPDERIPPNYFTARWATRVSLESGPYRINVTADDSVKVTVDYINVILNSIDDPKPGTTLSADFNLSAGSHYFQVDYRELTGDAFIEVTLERIDGATIPVIPTTPYAVVDAYSLRYRSGPSTDYEILGQEQRDTIVNLIGRNPDATWVQVVTPSGAEGWMSAAYLNPSVDLSTLPVLVTEGAGSESPQGMVYDKYLGIVTATVLTVRDGSDISAEPIGYVTRFTPLSIVGRNAGGTWLMIFQEDGTIGWVSATFVLTDIDIYSLPVLSI